MTTSASSRNPVVAIDGPAGSGKSTVAKAVAQALALPALDTGAMYRALTWAVLDAGIDPADSPAVIAVAQRFDLEVGPPVRVDGRDVTDAIRTPQVSAAVSVVAAVPEVRTILVAAQRSWIAEHRGGVVEGRDIGSVVAPDALLKIYLEASEEERARRRLQQDDAAEGAGTGLAATQAAINRRDAIDSGRAVSPLAVAADAVVLDTTGLSVEGVVDEVLRRYQDALKALPDVAPPAAPVSDPAPAAASPVPLPSPPRRWELLAYRFVRAIVHGLSRLLWRITVVHPERVPEKGACVLAPSHRSYLDTPFLACVTRRRIRFMGKAELWKYGWSAKFLSALGGFPVDRAGADRAALRAAQAALEGGEPLGMFPEGTRRSGPVIEEMHHGVAFLAARLGVPIVPIGIGGSESILARGRRLPRLNRVVVVVGEPILPPERVAGASVRRGDVTALTEQLQQAIQKLFDEAEALALPR